MIFKPVRMLGMPQGLLGLILLFCVSATSAEADHSIWNSLLVEHVQVLRQGRATQLNYAGIRQQQSELETYLQQLASISREEFESWEHSHQLAFLINAYNAWTVQLILAQDSDLESIRDIGFLPNAAWRRDIVALFGEQISLDDLEHGMIRGWGRYNEPRIHFAVNCAAVGCPALRAEAYEGDRLALQLEDSTALFLADRERNYIDGDRLYVSRIFDWYEEDFEKGWNGIRSVAQFLLQYSEQLGLSAEEQEALATGQLRVRYAEYDWDLNRLTAPR